MPVALLLVPLDLVLAEDMVFYGASLDDVINETASWSSLTNEGPGPTVLSTLPK